MNWLVSEMLSPAMSRTWTSPKALSCPLSHSESSLFLCPEGIGPERGRALLPAELALRAEQDENLGRAV